MIISINKTTLIANFSSAVNLILTLLYAVHLPIDKVFDLFFKLKLDTVLMVFVSTGKLKGRV